MKDPIQFQTKDYPSKEILDNLHPFVKEWFTSKFRDFSPPQKYAIRNIQLGINSLISSPTGSGKCVTPDTPILVSEKGKVKIVTGQQLIDKTQNTPLIARFDKTGKLHYIDGLESFSFNGHFTENQQAMVFHEDYKGNVIRIKTSYGREVTVSPEHPLLVERNENKVWIPARELKIGERIGVPRRIDLPELKIKLPWREAILDVKNKAKYVVDFEEYCRLKTITQNFKSFNPQKEDYYKFQLLTGKSMKDIATETGMGLTTIHRIFRKKTLYGREKIHEIFKQIRKNKFQKNEIIAQGNDGKITRFSFPKYVNEAVARWTAFVTAEGFIGEYPHGQVIAVCQKNKKGLLKQFHRDTKNLFGLTFTQKTDKDFILHATYAARFISKLLGIKSGKGRYVNLPDWLLNSTKRCKHEFVRVFFSLEAEAKENEVRLTQASRQKIEVLNYVLMSFNIFCSIGRTEKFASNTKEKIKRTYHTITIRGIENLKKFITFSFEHSAQNKISKHCKSKPSGKTIGKHYFDYQKIGSLSKNYKTRRDFEKDLGSVYEVVRRTGTITEDAMRKVIPRALEFGNQTLLLELEEKTSANLMWLQITNLETKHYEGKLVDLSVPGLENFVGGFGGLYLHNTLSAFLAIINHLVDQADKGILENRVYAVYISPLKALANDINRNLTEPLKEISEIAKKYNRKLKIKVGTRTGDTTPSQKASMLKNPPHIIITTPESFAIMLTTMKFSEMIRSANYMILDEIHSLAENKRGVHLSLSMERLARYCKFTRIGLSATVAPLEEVAKFLVGMEDPDKQQFRPCQIIDINRIEKGKYTKRLDLKVVSPVKDVMNASHNQMQEGMYNMIHDMIQNHRSTLIFTNTRAATERVVHQLKERYPKNYANILDVDEEQDILTKAEGKDHEHLAEEAELNTLPINERPALKEKSLIGAHHGSLARKHRLKIEDMLKAGQLRCVVCSTSLELGIDIGYIDLVILLGSPKSVARALQRIGRSGHKLHAEAKGRIIVLDRDDLVECSILLKSAMDKKIDRIDIPFNALDVLAQQIYGLAIEEVQDVESAFISIRKAYPYHQLSRDDFISVMNYLSGKHTELEKRSIYSKIWWDEDEGKFGKRGKLARLIYMTNVGTIPDETAIKVKIQDAIIGTVTEDFAERLKPGDVFVLGGEPYEFRFSRGMTVQVRTSAGKLPTVPSWISEMLPLNYDLASEIQKFRKYVWQMLNHGKNKEEIIEWLTEYLYNDEKSVESIYQYFYEQHNFSEIPHEGRLVIEHFRDGNKRYVFVHTLYGRRTNDVLSRAMAYVNGKLTGRDVEIGITDNGFYLKSTMPIQAHRALKLIQPDELYQLMDLALDKSEVLKRRFRHCAARALMILRNYKGESKSVGKQQMSSHLIMSALKRIDINFPILKEARREILEDLMDIKHAHEVITKIQKNNITIKEETTEIPSPFAFNLVMQGYTDLLKMEDRVEFVRRLHKMVLAEIEGKPKEQTEVLPKPEFTYERLWDKQREEERLKESDFKAYLKLKLSKAARKEKLQPEYIFELNRIIDEEQGSYPGKFKEWLRHFLVGTIPKYWPDDLVKYLKEKEDTLK